MRGHKRGGRWAPGWRPALVSRGSADLQHSLRERLRAEGASCRPRPGCSGQSHGRPARWVGVVRVRVRPRPRPAQALRPARQARVCVAGGVRIRAGLREAGGRRVCAGVHARPGSGGLEVIGVGCGVCVRVKTEAAGSPALCSGRHTWVQSGVWVGRGGEGREGSSPGQSRDSPGPRWKPRCVRARPSGSGNPPRPFWESEKVPELRPPSIAFGGLSPWGPGLGRTRRAHLGPGCARLARSSPFLPSPACCSWSTRSNFSKGGAGKKS